MEQRRRPSARGPVLGRLPAPGSGRGSGPRRRDNVDPTAAAPCTAGGRSGAEYDAAQAAEGAPAEAAEAYGAEAETHAASQACHQTPATEAVSGGAVPPSTNRVPSGNPCHPK